MSLSQRKKLLQNIPLFSELSEEELDIVLEESVQQTRAKDTELFSTGDKGDYMVVICSGNLRVFVEGPERQLILRDFGPGNYVGELSVLDGLPRSATVKTTEESTLLRIKKEPMMKLIGLSPAFAKKIIANLSLRLRETTQQLRQNTLFDVYGRIILWLIDNGLRERQIENDRLVVARPRYKSFADTINCAYETLCRAITDLDHLRFITVNRERDEIIVEKRALDEYKDLAQTSFLIAPST